MGDILKFGKKSSPQEEEPGCPHGSGSAFCLACSHEWQAVVPIGQKDFECPNCHRMTGHWKYEFSPPEDQVWTCNCGNQHFLITPKGTFCPSCGEYMRF